MQSTSQAWKGLFAAGAALQARAVIAGTVYSDIGAPVINRALMQDSLAVGNVVSASLSLALRGAGTVPRSAVVVIETRLNDGQTASEWLPQGTFYVSRRMRDPVTGVLALECYDALLKANAVWNPSAGAWPRTMAAVTAELAALLGVALDSRTAIPTGAAFAISEPAAGTTIRDVLSLVAQAAGGNWIMTPAGRLRLARLGEGGDTVDVAGVVGGIDVGAAGTVTGVRSTVDGAVTLAGDDTGIVLDVTVAPVIAAALAEDLTGQAWQPFRLAGAIYDPAAELGDGVRAGAGGEVASVLCSEQAAYGPAFRGDIAAPDAGEVTDEYPYIGSARRTLALAKAAVTEAVDRLDGELTQQEIFDRLTDNGAAQGLVLYNGQLYVNASYINAGEMSASRIRGGTLTLGGLNNQGGVLRVLDAQGNQIALWNNDGMNISKGLLRLEFDDEGSYVTLGAGVGIPLYANFKYNGKTYNTYIAGNNIIETDDDNFMALTTGALAIARNEADGSKPFVQCVDNVEGKSSVLDADSLTTGTLYVRNAAQTRANLGLTPANIGAVAKAGDNMTGPLNLANNTWNSIGDDIEIGDTNVAGCFSIRGKTGTTGINFIQENGTAASAIKWNGACFNVDSVLEAPRLSIKSGNWQFLYFINADGSEVGHVRGDPGADNRVVFREVTPSGGGFEDYYLPAPNASGAAGYLIFTTKNPPTAAQVGASPSSHTHSSITRSSGNWWNSGVIGGYHYEGADTSSNKLFSSYAEIFRWGTNDRAGAIGLDWRYGVSNYLWVNTLHDDGNSGNFAGWYKVSAGYADTAGNVTGTVAIANGGTGATSAAGARANLGATAVLNLDASTVAAVYAQITAAMPNNGDLAAFYAPSAVMGLITKVGSGAAKIPYAVQGVIRRAGAQIYDIFASTYGAESYSGRITFSNGSSISAAKIYKHTGTEV